MIKKIKIPIYNSSIVLIQVKKLKNIPKKYNPNFDTFGYDGLVWNCDSENGYRYFCLAVTPKIKTHQISHECNHIRDEIFLHHGIKYDLNNQEPAAYLLGWLVKMCHKHLKVKNSVNKK